MTLDVSEQERDFLSELLEAKYASLLHELHHTDTRDYKDLLKQRIGLLEGLRSKIGTSLSTDTAS